MIQLYRCLTHEGPLILLDPRQTCTAPESPPVCPPQVPRMVEGLTSHHCSQVAAAKDHTVVLTEEGYVYTFGLNTFHQLGLSPPPASAYVPKQVAEQGGVLAWGGRGRYVAQ